MKKPASTRRTILKWTAVGLGVAGMLAVPAIGRKAGKLIGSWINRQIEEKNQEYHLTVAVPGGNSSIVGDFSHFDKLVSDARSKQKPYNAVYVLGSYPIKRDESHVPLNNSSTRKWIEEEFARLPKKERTDENLLEIARQAIVRPGSGLAEHYAVPLALAVKHRLPLTTVETINWKTVRTEKFENYNTKYFLEKAGFEANRDLEAARKRGENLAEPRVLFFTHPEWQENYSDLLEFYHDKNGRRHHVLRIETEFAPRKDRQGAQKE